MRITMNVILSIAVAAAAGACSLTGIEAISVTVDDLPGLMIECRGDPLPTGEACLEWGRDVIADHPEEAADAAIIVLTDREGAGRCLADFQDENGAIYASVTSVCPG